MRLALAIHDGLGLNSVRYLSGELTDALSVEHELLRLPSEFEVAPDPDRERMRADLLEACDAIVGYHSVMTSLLATRSRLGLAKPAVVFALGAFPRGANTIRRMLPYLRTDDVLVVTSSPDFALANRFLANVNVALLPFAYDEGCYVAVTESERRAIREQLGFDDSARVAMYAGRMTLEKNVHTVLRVFACLHREVPNAHLVLAGPIEDASFAEFGVTPLRYERVLAKLISALGVDSQRVRYMGPLPSRILHKFYVAADVMLNMTLHHDENFGMSQVEAAASGTPTVGTAWGGLRDTIIDGVNGYRVGTVVTDVGVKVNWWEAANRAMTLLNDMAGASSLRSGASRSSTRYSRAIYRSSLSQILSAASAESGRASAPVLATAFADRFWDECMSTGRLRPRYQIASSSFDLYRSMIGTYAGRSVYTIAPGQSALASDLVVLASPVEYLSTTEWRIVDPIYPFVCRVPCELASAVGAMLCTLTASPVIETDDLLSAAIGSPEHLRQTALRWLLDTGLALASRPDGRWLSPRNVESSLGSAYCNTQMVDCETVDLVAQCNVGA